MFADRHPLSRPALSLLAAMWPGAIIRRIVMGILVTFLAVGIASYLGAVTVTHKIEPTAIAWGGGNAWVYNIPPPSLVRWSLFFDTADDTDGVMAKSTTSALVLFENGHRLGPAHGADGQIRQTGGGIYSHRAVGEARALLFSTSDNRDPRHNEKIYKVRYPIEMTESVFGGALDLLLIIFILEILLIVKNIMATDLRQLFKFVTISILFSLSTMKLIQASNLPIDFIAGIFCGILVGSIAITWLNAGTSRAFFGPGRAPAFTILAASITAYCVVALIFRMCRGHDLYMVGSDGDFYKILINIYYKWADIFTVHTPVPFSGLANLPIPMDVWINPGWLIFHWLGPGFGLILAAGFFAGCYLVATYSLGVTVRSPSWLALISAQLALLLTHEPYSVTYFNELLYRQFAINPSVSFIVGLLLISLALTLRIAEEFRPVRLTALVGALAAIGAYTIVLDPLWASVLAFSAVPFFMAAVNWRKPVRQLVILLLVCAVLWASGLLDYLMTLPKLFARETFPQEIHSEVQIGDCASLLWHGWRGACLYILMMVGWIFLFKLGESGQRRLAIGCLIHGGLVQMVSVVFLFTSKSWSSLPLPMYLEICAWPIYVLTATLGWYQLVLRRTIFERIVAFSGHQKNWLANSSVRMSSESSLSIARVAPWLMVGLILWPGMIYSPQPPSLKGMISDGGISDEVIDTLTLQPGTAFRGNLAMILGVDETPYYGSRNYTVHASILRQFGGDYASWHFWDRGVPTLDEYGQMVTSQFYYFATRLLARSIDYQSRNFIWFTKADQRILQLLGVRFLITDAAHDDIGATLNRTVLGNEGTRLYLYQFPHPNLGTYSPTEVVPAESGPEIIAALRSPTFDPQRQVASTASERLPADLRPAQSARLTPIVGGFRVEATSDGLSLLLLPVQYSHCWRVEGDASARLVRADFVLTGLLFDRHVDLTLRHSFGYLSSACRKVDAQDMHLLKVDTQGTAHVPAFLHPLALPGL